RALWAARPRAPIAVRSPRALPADVRAVLATTEGALPAALARSALEAYGVHFCREESAATAEEAVRAADRIGYPVVVKADRAGLMHKTEVGGVRMDLGDGAAVRRACAELTARARAQHFVVQARVGPGVELLIGARRDESFGPVVAAGVGGIFTEVMREVAFRLAPLGRDEARTLLRGGARGRLLAGPRGLPACEGDALVDTLLGVGDLMLAEPRILEIDLNPVIAAGREAVAVDVLLIAGPTAG
ncbi:MAG: acetate--CoA ligase family protein, partial [Candidatus Rokuibacteriota bacterium]